MVTRGGQCHDTDAIRRSEIRFQRYWVMIVCSRYFQTDLVLRSEVVTEKED
jgi:hypothetical protein